nr:VWA domain-containing protein [Lachnospiraceae bacterium]
MFCKKCGAELENGAKFCKKCGTPVSQPAAGEQPHITTGMTNMEDSTPEYKDVAVSNKGTKALILVAVICAILAVLGILGFIFFPTIKEKAADITYNGTYTKAEEAYENGDYDAAVGYYLKLIEQRPEEPAPYIGAARSYNELGKTDKAIDILVDGYKATGYDDSDEESAGDESILELLVEYLENEGKTLEDVDIHIKSQSDTDKPDEDDASGGEGDSSDADDQTSQAAQTPPGEKTDLNIEVRQVDNSDFPNIKVYANLTDKDGNTVENLTTSDFDVTEIDKNGNVSTVGLDNVYKILGEGRINVNLVLDASGSMSGNKMPQAQNAAKSLMDHVSLDTGDKMEVISFDDYVYLEQDFTSRKELLVTAVDGIAPGGSTALYDAIYAGVYQTYFENGAKCVIAFTDGEENASSYTFDDVVAIAKNTSIPVFIIGIGDYSYDSSVLQQLATQCSGRYYSANDSDLESILEDIYIDIYQEQQDYYVFEYTSTNTNDLGEFRDLVIDTSDESLYSGHYVKSYVPESDINGAFSKDYMNKDYILDFSSDRAVTNSDLTNLSLAELRIARNEIYARHGRQFKDPLLNQWFYSR